jgi:hypothetical protein
MSDSDLFKKIGFDDKKAAETAKNKELSATLRTIIEEVCLFVHVCMWVLTLLLLGRNSRCRHR